MESASAILDWLVKGGPFGLIALLVIFAFIWRIKYNYSLFFPANDESGEAKQRTDRARYKRLVQIAEGNWEKKYLSMLGRVLNMVAQRLVGDQAELNTTTGNTGWTGRLFGLNPFSGGSYMFCLLLALVYPLLGLILVWGSGGSSEIGGLNLLPDTASAGLRMLFIFLLGLIVFLLWKVATSTGWKGNVYLIFAIALSFVLTIADTDTDSVAFVFTFAGAFVLTVVVAFARAFASEKPSTYGIAFIFVGTFAIVFVLTFSLALSFAVAVVDTVAFAGAVDVTFALAVAIDVTFAFTVAFVFAVAVSFAVMNAIPYAVFSLGMEDLVDSFNTKWVWFLLNLLFFSAIVALVIWHLPRIEHTEMLLLPVFLALLPLLNGALDWFSLGFTRGLLYAIHSSHHTGLVVVGWALLDIGLALLFLFLITSIIALVMGGLNGLACLFAGLPLLDLQLIFDGMSIDPLHLDYWWIHFMVLSTLIPTLVHFFIASYALVLSMQPYQGWIIGHIDDLKDGRLAGFLYITFVPVLGIFGVYFMSWLLFRFLESYASGIGRWLLAWVRGVAALLDPGLTTVP